MGLLSPVVIGVKDPILDALQGGGELGPRTRRTFVEKWDLFTGGLETLTN